MPRYFFHCTDGDRFLLDEIGADLANLDEAHIHALQIARDISGRISGVRGWSGWSVQVTDELAQKVLIVPFPTDSER